MDEPFYSSGLCFECQNCSYCCSSEPGYVYLSAQDVLRASTGLGISVDDFLITCCRRAGDMISLKEKENYDCIFLTEKGCSIYKYRPVQCRTYPFWRRIVESGESWKEEAMSCPGIGKGRRYSKEEIEAVLSENDENTPIIL